MLTFRDSAEFIWRDSVRFAWYPYDRSSKSYLVIMKKSGEDILPDPKGFYNMKSKEDPDYEGIGFPGGEGIGVDDGIGWHD